MTRAFANKVSKECLRQSVTTSLNDDRRSILTHERVVCGGLRHATGLDSWCGLSLPRARTHCGHQLEAHQHFDYTWSRNHLCRHASSEPIRTTSTFELNSIASGLIEDRSTGTAERDGIASVAHLSHRDNRPLQSSVLGCNPVFTRSKHWISHISSLRISREQHVPDSSNHSLYLMKLFVFSCPEGNKLLSCSILFRPFLHT